MHLRWNTRDTEIVQYMWNIRIWVYTLVIVLFLSPHYSEFLFLDIVHDRISGFTSCRKKIYRTPSNQWIPLPYYGCLLYIKKKKKFHPYHHLPYIVQWLTIIICACYGVPPLLFYYLFWIKIPFSWIGLFLLLSSMYCLYSVCRM